MRYIHVHVGDETHVWVESEHPRGQPENKGEFASSPGGGGGPDSPGGEPAAHAQTNSEPKKTVTTYKQFRTLPNRPGELFPLFIGNKQSVPIGKWVAAQNTPTKGFAPRPGWHSGELPIGKQLRSHEDPAQRQQGRVWAQVSVPADVDWQKEADRQGGQLKNQVPEGGHYRFLEASQKGGRGTPWYISGAVRVDKTLSDDEVADILKKAGRPEEVGPETRFPGAGPGGATFASPNIHELPPMTSQHAIATAQAGLQSRRQKLFEQAAADVDHTLGISSVERPAIGAWTDGAEATTMMIAPHATADQLRLSAAMKGWLGQQKAVLSFAADPNGQGMLYSALVKGEPDDIHRALLAQGIENHTLVPAGNAATIYIADTDGSAADMVAKYARAAGVKFKGYRGNAEFLGAEHYEGTTDAEQRAEGRRAYEAVIAAAGDRGGADDWGRLRDRWAAQLQQTQDRRAGRLHVHVGDQELVLDAEAWVNEPRKGTGPGGGEWTAGGGGGAARSFAPKAVQVHIHQPGGETRHVTVPAKPPKPALTGSSGHPAMISSRVVTAKRSAENSQATYTQTGLAAMKADPASFAASMELLKNPQMYPYFKGLHGSADEIAEQALGQMVANIKYVYANAPPLTRQWGKEWYRQENKAAQREAARTGLPLASVAGAYAALSPQRDWNMNVFLSEAVIHAMTREQKTPWSDAMASTGERIAQTTALKALLKRVEGKSLGELQLPAEKALWVRLWEQSRPAEQRYYRLFRPDGKLGDWARNNDGAKATPTWGSIAQIANAIKSVESGGDREIISEAMGDANKVRSFYNNILDPDSPNGDITADTHAIGVSLLDALGGSTAPVMHGLGTSPEAAKHPPGWKAAPSPNKTGVKGLYGLHAEAYRRAAKDLGVLPDEVQSLVWEAKRGLFEHMPAGAKAAIHKTWEAYHRGEIEFPQAQAQVVKQAGGWKEPDWVREPRDD